MASYPSPSKWIIVSLQRGRTRPTVQQLPEKIDKVKTVKQDPLVCLLYPLAEKTFTDLLNFSDCVNYTTVTV